MKLPQFFTKRNVLIAAGSFVLLVVGIGVVLRPLQILIANRSVSLTFGPGVTSVVITNNEAVVNCSGTCPDIIQETLYKSGQIALPDGQYTAIPSGDTVLSDTISFTVNKNSTSFAINPDYTDEYLTTLLQTESASIRGAIQTAYPETTESYAINGVSLYGHGEWCIASLTTLDGGGSDVYAVVLHKANGIWQLATKPGLHFTYSDYPAVPKDILYQANVGR